MSHENEFSTIGYFSEIIFPITGRQEKHPRCDALDEETNLLTQLSAIEIFCIFFFVFGDGELDGSHQWILFGFGWLSLGERALNKFIGQSQAIQYIRA